MSESLRNPDNGSRISPWRAVLRVLTDPVATFRAMAEKPPVLVPYLVHMLVGLAVMALTYGKVVEIATQATASAMSANQEIDLELMRAMMKWSAGASLAVSALIGPWVAGFVLSLVAMFFGQFEGGGVPLSAYMGMIGYARLPLAILNLLAGIFLAATGRQLNLSAAVLLPETASPYLVGLLSSFNPLYLWYYVLLGIGFAALFDREPRKGWALPVTVFVVTTLLNAVAVGVTSAFTPTMMN